MCMLCGQEDWFCEHKALYGFKPISNIKTGMIKEQPLKIYLAIPYSFNPELSFKIANKVAAKLISEGHIVFSPISHSHMIAKNMGKELQTDSDYWLKQDLSFIDWCDEVYVINIVGQNGLIENSKGVRGEWKYAIEKRKPVKVINHTEKQFTDHRL